MNRPSLVRRLFAAVCGLSALGGCASATLEAGARSREASYREKAAAWIGKTEIQLKRGLGEPNNSSTVPSGDTFDEYRDAGCALTFQIDPKGVVASVDWKGADCSSPDASTGR